jgi:CMP-N-acetylneuraminic acid synthetase
MKNIAIIPARGGSKRLPRKNILSIGQKPLLQWVVESCLESKVFDKVIVSTEDDEIQKVAEQAGAYVHKRNLALAQDRSTVVEVCEEVLMNEKCEGFCCVYATSALLSARTLQLSSQQFIANTSVSVLMGASKYNYSPVQALSVDENGFSSMLFPEYMKIQSQFHPKTRVSNGTFYWARAESFLKEKTFYSASLKTFDVPEDEVCDLDTLEDFEKLQAMFKRL